MSQKTEAAGSSGLNLKEFVDQFREVVPFTAKRSIPSLMFAPSAERSTTAVPANLLIERMFLDDPSKPTVLFAKTRNRRRCANVIVIGFCLGARYHLWIFRDRRAVP